MVTKAENLFECFLLIFGTSEIINRNISLIYLWSWQFYVIYAILAFWSNFDNFFSHLGKMLTLEKCFPISKIFLCFKFSILF